MLPSLPRQPGKNQHDTAATLRRTVTLSGRARATRARGDLPSVSLTQDIRPPRVHSQSQSGTEEGTALMPVGDSHDGLPIHAPTLRKISVGESSSTRHRIPF